MFAEILMDTSPPSPGFVNIITSENAGEADTSPKNCQQSATTMEIDFNGFEDPESGIEKYHFYTMMIIGTGWVCSVRRPPSKGNYSR